MLVEFLALLASLLLTVLIYFKHSHKYWKDSGVPQLQPNFPFGDFASVIFRRKNMATKIKEIYDDAKKKNHQYVGLYFFSRKALLAVDPVLIKHILVKDFQYFNDRGLYYDEINDPLSAHLFSLAGNKWKNLRTKLTPAYSPGKLKYMFETIKCCGDQMVNLLKETAQTENTLEIKEVFARYTTDVIGSCAFGLDCNSLRNPNAEFRMMGKRAFTQTVGDSVSIVIIRSFPRLARILRLGIFARSVTDFFKKVVTDTIEYRENSKLVRNDFLQLLIQLKNNGKLDEDNHSKLPQNIKPSLETALTMNEAAAQAFIFFLAGFETTSTTISFALFELSLNKTMQNLAREEINKVLSNHEQKLCYEAVADLHYLETIIYGKKIRLVCIIIIIVTYNSVGI